MACGHAGSEDPGLHERLGRVWPLVQHDKAILADARKHGFWPES
jgi:hypothetical protein